MSAADPQRQPEAIGLEAQRVLLALAAAWAEDAGAVLAWRDQLMTSMLTDKVEQNRALWRCTLELSSALEALSGRKLAELLADPLLQPIQQDAKRPGG